MAWNTKKYSRINWKNRPSTATALGATNLNHMDVFLNEVDNGMIEFEASKLNIATANSMIAALTIDVNTGIIKATQLDGTVFTWDLNLEKIPVSFSLSQDGVLTMTTDDGTEFTANIADLIKEYEFDDSDTIAFEKEYRNADDGKGAYHVTAIIKAGSINGEYLDPDYRADIQLLSNNAQTAADSSLQYSKDSKRWAVGDPAYEGSDTDNSKYYKEQAELAKDAAELARDEAQAATGITIMTPENLGVGKPDNVSVKVLNDGTIYAPGSTPDFYGAYADFPKPGTPGILYVDDTVDPRLMYTWDETAQKYVLTGGAGGADGGSVDIPLTILSTGWTGTTAPYTQTLTVPQMREGMTPLYFFSGTGDDELYAFYLIMGCTAGYAEITFTAADLPATDIHLTLKGVPAQELEVVDNQVVFLVEPSAFSLNEEFDRYEANITVEGMTAGYGGQWGIVRSGSVLSLEESQIAASITDVDRLDGAVRIVCLEAPMQRYMMSISGAYPDADPGTVILSGMQGWFDQVETLESELDISQKKITILENRFKPVVAHNANPRGINLSEKYSTDDIMAMISDGTFEDIFVGDYFDKQITTSYGGTETIRILASGCDPYMLCGDTALTRHHLAVITKDCFKTMHYMNETNTTEGGYASSKMHTEILPVYYNALQNALGNHIITYRALLTNAVNLATPSSAYTGWNGAGNGWGWADCNLRLMTEIELYGSQVFGSSGYEIGIGNMQLPIFHHFPWLKIAGAGYGGGKMWYWLSSVSSDSGFATRDYYGNAGYSGASAAGGVRPLFLVG